jgi:hypothetical protein
MIKLLTISCNGHQKAAPLNLVLGLTVPEKNIIGCWIGTILVLTHFVVLPVSAMFVVI